MKTIIFVFVLFIFALPSCFSQTYIAPVIGYEFVKTGQRAFDRFTYGVVFHYDGYVENQLLGSKIEQAFGNKFAIAVQSLYAKRNIRSSFYGCFSNGEYYLSYRNFQNSVFLRYSPFSFLSLAMGYDFNITKDIKNAYSPNMIGEIKDRGLLFSTGFHWRNFELTGFYHKGLNADVLNIREDYAKDLTNYATTIKAIPTNAFGITLSYKIKVFGGCASKKDKKISSPMASI